MADYDDPFQMDEELPNYSNEEASQKLKSKSKQNPSYYDGDASATKSEPGSVKSGDSEYQQLITPRYTDPSIIDNPDIMYQDDENIRSKLATFKMNGESLPQNPTPAEAFQSNEKIRATHDHDDMNNTNEDDKNNNANDEPERVYEEDGDDKFDQDQKAQMEEDYKNYTTQASSFALSSPQVPLTPPENFAPVINQIYRSSFPQPNNFTFLTKLKLKSVLCLIPEEYPEIHQDFFRDQGIRLFQLGMSGNKEPFVKIPHDLITEAIKIVLDPRNQPILIHCNRGKHRTGCLVGVLRRLQKWSFTIIFDEYRKFASPKERPMDQQFIELYDETELVQYAEEKCLLPLQWN